MPNDNPGSEAPDLAGIRAIDLSDVAWARERLEREAARALLDAGVFGKKLLKGFGYPDEVFCRAQDYRAITIILALVDQQQQTITAQGAQIAEMGAELETRKRLWKEHDAPFHEWAQSYLNSARWAGHDRAALSVPF